MNYEYFIFYLSYIGALFQGYAPIVQMMIVMVTGLILLTLFSFSRLLYAGVQSYTHDKRRKSIDERYGKKLNFVLSSSKIYSREEIRNLIITGSKSQKCWETESLTKLLLKTRSVILAKDDVAPHNFEASVQALGLIDYWQKRAKGSCLLARKRALRKLSDLNSSFRGGLLSKSIYHKDQHLRKLARSVYTLQEEYNPFRFMDEHFDKSFDTLDEIRLHATFSKYSKTGKLPNLLRWGRYTKNPNYLSFMIREIGFFKQVTAAPILMDMLATQENTQIRAQIMKTLGELRYEEASSLLRSYYEIESPTVRSAIIRALSQIQSNENLDFLHYNYEQTEDVDLKIRIARSIYSYPQGSIYLNKIADKTSEMNRLIVDQVAFETSINPSYSLA